MRNKIIYAISQWARRRKKHRNEMIFLIRSQNRFNNNRNATKAFIKWLTATANCEHCKLNMVHRITNFQCPIIIIKCVLRNNSAIFSGQSASLCPVLGWCHHRNCGSIFPNFNCRFGFFINSQSFQWQYKLVMLLQIHLVPGLQLMFFFFVPQN